MAQDPRDTAEGESEMDVSNLYREDSYTDRKLGVIRTLTPVTGDGSLDVTRPVLFLGQAEIMTNAGPLPINFEIPGASLADAAKGFAAAAQQAIERTMQQIQEMRRQQASQLVVAPGNIPGLKDGPGGLGGRGGGKIQLP